MSKKDVVDYSWPLVYLDIKGYSRLGAAYSFLSNPEEAVKAYEKGLELDPDNATLKNELAQVKQKFSGKFCHNQQGASILI